MQTYRNRRSLALLGHQITHCARRLDRVWRWALPALRERNATLLDKPLERRRRSRGNDLGDHMPVIGDRNDADVAWSSCLIMPGCCRMITSSAGVTSRAMPRVLSAGCPRSRSSDAAA